MEPDYQTVDAFVQSHPEGGNFAEIAEVLGVTHQRAQQLVANAVQKCLCKLASRGVYGVRDVVSDQYGSPHWRE